jgi:hypothetical protein
MRDVNPSDHFWTVACNILIDIVNDRFFLGQAVHAVIAAGGDIEVTAHNEPGRITVALVAPSGLRQVVFDNKKGPPRRAAKRQGARAGSLAVIFAAVFGRLLLGGRFGLLGLGGEHSLPIVVAARRFPSTRLTCFVVCFARGFHLQFVRN